MFTLHVCMTLWLQSLELMHTNYEAELAERVYTDLTDYIDQFPVYKVISRVYMTRYHSKISTVSKCSGLE